MDLAHISFGVKGLSRPGRIVSDIGIADFDSFLLRSLDQRAQHLAMESGHHRSYLPLPTFGYTRMGRERVLAWCVPVLPPLPPLSLTAFRFSALIKVILISMFIIVGLIYDWGGVIGHPGPGLSNFNDEPFYGGFAGLASSFTYAFYSYGGVELVAIAAGESAQPHKSVPRAIRATFARIILFYM